MTRRVILSDDDGDEQPHRKVQTMKNLSCMLTLLLILTLPGVAAANERLRVGHDLWIGFSGVFLAQELGYFADAGLDVDMRGFPGPGDSIPPVLAGHLDITLTTLHNLALIAGTDNAELSAVYFLDSSHGADAIVARRGIGSVAELRGRDVAVTLNEANHMLLILALEAAGMSEADVRLVNMSADDAGAALLAGRVDAAVTWEPWVSRARSGGDGHVIFSTRDAPDTILNTITVRRDTLEKRPEALKAFIQAVDRGVAYLRSHPQRAIPIIARWLEADEGDVSDMLADDEIYNIAENRALFQSPDASGMKALETVIDFLYDRELIQRRPSAEELTDDRFIR